MGRGRLLISSSTVALSGNGNDPPFIHAGITPLFNLTMLQSDFGAPHRGIAPLKKRFRVRVARRQSDLAFDGADAVGQVPRLTVPGRRRSRRSGRSGWSSERRLPHPSTFILFPFFATVTEPSKLSKLGPGFNPFNKFVDLASAANYSFE